MQDTVVGILCKYQVAGRIMFKATACLRECIEYIGKPLTGIPGIFFPVERYAPPGYFLSARPAGMIILQLTY